jgi:hypothetical protein
MVAATAALVRQIFHDQGTKTPRKPWRMLSNRWGNLVTWCIDVLVVQLVFAFNAPAADLQNRSALQDQTQWILRAVPTRLKSLLLVTKVALRACPFTQKRKHLSGYEIGLHHGQVVSSAGNGVIYCGMAILAVTLHAWDARATSKWRHYRLTDTCALPVV